MILKPITTEKAVRIIEIDNTLIFETDRTTTRDQMKREVEKIFNVKVKEVRSMIHNNKKRYYVRLTKEFPAIDVATKLGMI